MQWGTLWFGLVVMHPWFVPSKNPVNIFSFIRILQEMFGSFFLDPSVLLAPIVLTFSETSNDHALCCMLNHGNTLVQLLHCLSLSSCQLESTLPSAAQVLLSQSQQDDLVEHHMWISNLLEIISRPSCEPLMRQTLPTVNRKYFFMNILCIETFCSQKNAQQNYAHR
jgi:hypothetical protein